MFKGHFVTLLSLRDFQRFSFSGCSKEEFFHQRRNALSNEWLEDLSNFLAFHVSRNVQSLPSFLSFLFHWREDIVSSMNNRGTGRDSFFSFPDNDNLSHHISYHEVIWLSFFFYPCRREMCSHQNLRWNHEENLLSILALVVSWSAGGRLWSWLPSRFTWFHP